MKPLLSLCKIILFSTLSLFLFAGCNVFNEPKIEPLYRGYFSVLISGDIENLYEGDEARAGTGIEEKPEGTQFALDLPGVSKLNRVTLGTKLQGLAARYYRFSIANSTENNFVGIVTDEHAVSQNSSQPFFMADSGIVYISTSTERVFTGAFTFYASERSALGVPLGRHIVVTGSFDTYNAF